MKTYKTLTDRQPVPLTSDFVFKYVFGAKQSTEILRSLLSVVDVKATDVTGATYTMEAQATWHAAFSSRALYYWARSYANQLTESEFYSRLQPVVGVNVMDFRLFPETAGAPLHTSFRACCPEAPQLTPLTDFIIHFIELPQFIHRDGVPSTVFGQWMYYIKYRGKEGAMEDPIMKAILEDTSDIREAEKRYQEFTADAELRDRLEARDKFRRTHLQLLHDAEQKGRRQTARKMKNDGLAIADIARYTDLPEEEIREL